MIRAKYGAIESVRDICEPWVKIWAGDEWGESMLSLHGAAQTSYGLSDEDCATVAEILMRNVVLGKEFQDSYQIASEEQVASARKQASDARRYWLKGGNLGAFSTTIEDAKSSIEQFPAWMFDGESQDE